MQDPNTVIDPQDRPIFGVAKIARALGLGVREAQYLVKTGRIHVGRHGKKIFATPRTLKADFKVEA